MTLFRGALAAVLLALPAAAQDPASTPGDAIRSREKTWRTLEGIQEVTVCGANGEKHIVVRVDGERARDAVRAEFGEKIDGYRLIVLVCPPPAPRNEAPLPAQPIPAPAARPTVSAPPPEHEFEACDLVREALRLPYRKTKHSSSSRCVWMRRTVFGGASSRDPYALLRGVATPMGATPWFGGRYYMSTAWACEYAKHRDDCPVIRQVRREWVDRGMPPVVTVPLVMGPAGPQALPPPPPRRIYYGDPWPWYWYGYPRYFIPVGGWRR